MATPTTVNRRSPGVARGAGEPAAVGSILLLRRDAALCAQPEPDHQRLAGWQRFVFSLIGIVGVVLEAILLAAVSGPTLRS